jgi:predicted small secreted protein
MSVLVRCAAVLAVAVSLAGCATGNGIHQDWETTKQTVKDSAHAAKDGIVDTGHAIKNGAVNTGETIKQDVKGNGDPDSD